MSYSPASPRGGGGGGSPRRYRSPSPGQRGGGQPFDKNNSSTLFVGNLPFNLREREMSDLFGKYGKLRHVKVGVDRHSGKSLGYGFVEFDDRKDAEAAFKKFDRYELYGRVLRLDWDVGYDKKRQLGGSNNGGGRGGGRRGYGGSRGRRYSPYGGGRGRSPRRYSRSPPRRRYSRSPPRRYERYDRRPPYDNRSPRGHSPSPRGAGSPRRGYSPEGGRSPRDDRRFSGSPRRNDSPRRGDDNRGGSPPQQDVPQ